MKLNLGSGAHCIEGFCNIDRAYSQSEEFEWNQPNGYHKVRTDIFPLVSFQDVTEIRASHCLEHLSFRDTMAAIQDWVRVLKPGGVLKIAVPDFEWIARQYLREVDDDAERDPKLTMYLMGGQTDENDYHKAIFDARGLKHGMELAGLVDVKPWVSEVADCASLPVSLNLQGTKPPTSNVLKQETPGEWFDREQRNLTNPLSEPAKHQYAWLTDRCYNKYSQWGEDGMLEAIFERIGTKNKFVIECGAGHPVRGSNSRKLIEEGWGAYLVEPDEAKYEALRQEYETNRNVWMSSRNANSSGPLGLDYILSGCIDMPSNPDLLILDVDGQEWYLFNGLIKHHPRVIVIEFDHNDNPNFIPEADGEGQAGYAAIEALACYKGYRPIVRNGNNIICVHLNDVDLLDNPAEARNALRDITGEHPDHISHFMEVSEPAKDEYLEEPTEKEGHVLFKPQEIGAMMSCPRLGFMDNMFSCYAIAATGIHLERSGGAFWDQGLTRLMENAIAAGRKYLLTLDYDSVFVAQDVIELYRIMASPGGETIDALVAMQIRREKEGVLLTVAGEDGKNRNLILSTELEETILPIRTGHFGLTLIRAEALKRMPKPWFMPVPDEKGEWGDNRRDSDVQFWCQWHECGNTVCAAPRVVIGHTQMVLSWPDKNLKTMHQAMSDYQENGKPPTAWR